MNPRPTHAIPSKLIQVLKPIIEVRQKKLNKWISMNFIHTQTLALTVFPYHIYPCSNLNIKCKKGRLKLHESLYLCFFPCACLKIPYHKGWWWWWSKTETEQKHVWQIALKMERIDEATTAWANDTII
jgi:hypothetical protein